MIELDKIYNEDCLQGMKRIDDESIDCIICDLPYEVLNDKNPEWTGPDLEDPEHNTDLRNAMYDAVRCRLGSMYCHQRQGGGQQTAPANATAASGAQGWQPTAEQPFPPQQDTDDLPF